VPGVVSAEVSCATGKAVCEVKPDTDVSLLVTAIENEGFSATPKN
jgi:hypothetical protein